MAVATAAALVDSPLVNALGLQPLSVCTVQHAEGAGGDRHGSDSLRATTGKRRAPAAGLSSASAAAGESITSTGDVGALVSALAQLQQGQTLTVAPLPLLVSNAANGEHPSPAPKRPRRAASQSAVAALHAEQQQAAGELPLPAQLAALAGRLYRFSVASQPAGLPQRPAPLLPPSPQQVYLTTAVPAAAVGQLAFDIIEGPFGRAALQPAAGASGPPLVQPPPQQHPPQQQPQQQRQPQAEQQLRAQEHAEQPLGLPAVATGTGTVAPTAAAAAAAVATEAATADAETSVFGFAGSGSMRIPQAAAEEAEEEVAEAGVCDDGDEDEEVSEEDEEEDGELEGQQRLEAPNSPTASEAALLNELMQERGSATGGVIEYQPEIAMAFAHLDAGGTVATAFGGTAGGAGLPRKPRGGAGGRLGKRKGGMPALCPGCGAQPLSEEDKRAASKRGRRRKNDETDPRNRKAELSKDFLVRHLLTARLSLRDICFYHGHCATTVSRVARNLGMELPSGRSDRKADSSQQHTQQTASQQQTTQQQQAAAEEGSVDGTTLAVTGPAGDEGGEQGAVQGGGTTTAGSAGAGAGATLAYPADVAAVSHDDLPEVMVVDFTAEQSKAAALEALGLLEAAAPQHTGVVASAMPAVIVAQRERAAALAAAAFANSAQRAAEGAPMLAAAIDLATVAACLNATVPLLGEAQPQGAMGVHMQAAAAAMRGPAVDVQCVPAAGGHAPF